MAEEEQPQEDAPRKRSRLPLFVGLGLALAGGGGGFYAAYSGLLPFPGSPAPETGAQEDGQRSSEMRVIQDVEFVAIEPLVISLQGDTHLRFRAQLEVRAGHRAEVEHLLPRVIDVLNGYLRAVDIADLRDNAALVRLRAQMLRRVRIVTGGDRVSDLLIMEFVLN